MIKRISTNQTPDNVAQVLGLLAATPRQLAALSAGLDVAAWHRPLGLGQRSPVEILAHLINVEARSHEAIILALAADEPLLTPVHPERQYGRLLRHDLLPPAESLAYFGYRRAALLRLLGGLSDAQWTRVIREPGKARHESVYWRARSLALHEAEHLEELAAMSVQNAPHRLYLMQVGSMPEYQIPIVCYLVQTADGQNILIDSGLPEIIPEEESEFENGQDVIEQLASLGLKPDDIETVISTHYDGDHAGRHAAFTKATYVVQRVHHLDAESNPRFAAIRPQWDQPMERIRLVDGDTELLPGLELIETSGHVPGHQSVLVRLPQSGAILLTIDAVPFAEGFTRDEQDDGSDPDAAATRASVIKLLDRVEREHIGLVIFGHDTDQWVTLKKAPEFYE